MIHLRDEYTFAAVFADTIKEITIGDADGGRDANGWYPGDWETLGNDPIAAINQYGEVFPAKGSADTIDLQDLVDRINPAVRMWDGKCYLKTQEVSAIPGWGKALKDVYVYPKQEAKA